MEGSWLLIFDMQADIEAVSRFRKHAINLYPSTERIYNTI
jgi:hypothetical protein